MQHGSQSEPRGQFHPLHPDTHSAQNTQPPGMEELGVATEEFDFYRADLHTSHLHPDRVIVLQR
jgi:hypothetical protein